MGPRYGQELVGPDIRPGVAGLFLITGKERKPPLPQSLMAFAVIALGGKAGLNGTCMMVSFIPAPAGWLTVVIPACDVQI